VAGSTVEYEIYVRAQAAADVLGGGRRKFGEAVGAGCCDGNAGGADEGKRDRVRGHPETDGGKAGGDDVGNCRLLFELLFEHQRQRAGPESAGQTAGDFWPVRDQPLRHFYGCYVDNKRASARSAFHSVDAGYSFGVEGVGAETVDGFGGEGDEPAGAKEPRAVVNFAGIGDWGHSRL